MECDETRADFRIRTRYCDAKTHDLDEALAMIDGWTKAGEAKSVALIGNAAELFPENDHLHRCLDMARKRIAFQGLPARISWLGLGDRRRAGLKFNEMVASGELKAPIVIGRVHLDTGSVASPNRETAAMRDGSDAVSDLLLVNALMNTASGAIWVSLHHGGSVGMGFSQHSGVMIVADGTPEASKRLKRVWLSDPKSGLWQHLSRTPSLKLRNAKVKLSDTIKPIAGMLPD